MPPPLPVLPAPAAPDPATAEAPEEPPPSQAAADQKRAAQQRAAQRRAAKQAERGQKRAADAPAKRPLGSRTEPATKPARAAPTKAAQPAAAQPAPAPAGARAERTPAPRAAPSVAGRVRVPSTAHVRAEVPPGLQRDLDADPRMQSWLDRVFAVIDACHAKNRRATGTLEAAIVMHENARPDADIRALPPALSGVVACATGSLLRIKMPLFTGREGTRHIVRIRFE